MTMPCKQNSDVTFVKALRAQIGNIEAVIMEYQKQCEHRNIDVVYKADTGNYCKGDDRYWKVITCRDCEKIWEEDQ